jgi:1-acyl-sn-glycerol-3-phosphate acyltransferase
MESKYLFEGKDSYRTPESNKASLLFRLMFRSRWYFYFINFTVFIRCGLCAAKGKLNKQMQIYYSNLNLLLIEKCGGKIQIDGLEHLRALNGTPVVLIGNHMSLIETAVFHALAREYIDFSFIIKESLLRVPFFRHIMIAMKAVPVGRINPREDLKTVLVKGKSVLEEGRCIIVFPQATRAASFEPEKFNTIGIKLAKSAGVKVVPFALKTDFLGIGKRFRDLGPVHPEKVVHFEFAPAMEITGNGQEQHKAIIDFIQSRFDEWNK